MGISCVFPMQFQLERDRERELSPSPWQDGHMYLRLHYKEPTQEKWLLEFTITNLVLYHSEIFLCYGSCYLPPDRFFWLYRPHIEIKLEEKI